MSGKRIVEGAEEALAVARGETPAERLHVNGHAYVPASRIEALEAEVARLKEALGDVVAWADDLRLFSERGTELAPVLQKAKAALGPQSP